MRKYLLFFCILLIFFSACTPFSRSPVGGSLPILVTESTDDTDGDVLALLQPTATPPTSAPTNHLGDNIPVSRAMVAKMLALAYSDSNAIINMPTVISFEDVSSAEWYFPYVNAAYCLGLMNGAGDLFKPDDPLPLGQAYHLLSALDPERKPGIAAPTDDNRDKPISYALWVELYAKLLEVTSGDKSIFETYGLEGANIITMTTASNNPNLKEGQFVADVGAFTCTGLFMDSYIDKEIRVFHKNREVVALVAIISDTPTLKNVYVTDSDKQGLFVFSGGAQRYYAYGEGVKPTDTLITDVTIENAVAVAVFSAEEKISGTIKKITPNLLELEEWGLVPLDNRFKVYDTTKGIEWRNAQALLPGAEMADFYIKDGVICAAVIRSEISPSVIRVLIGTSGYGGLIHSGVTVTSDTAFTVTAGNTEKTYTAGQRFSVSDIENTDLFGQPRLYIQTSDPNGKLQLVGLKRNWPDNASPNYRGRLEIAIEEKGYVVINEVSLEEYLYAVVPSEMPSSYGVEASKAQAVTARSYAYNQFYENRYRHYGAHVEDSVLSQVYNNIPESKTSVEAVDATSSLCLTYQGQVISANFFSTSGGMTANSGEVWASGGRFPDYTPVYLQSQAIHENGDFGDLRLEENAARFYKDKTIQAYDSNISWFRWQVQMTAAELTATVNANLPARRKAVPNLVQSESDNIGELTDIAILKRGKAGNIMEMRITGTTGQVHVLAEYNVRVLLAPKQYLHGGRDIQLHRKDGTYVSNYGLMPSAFFVMEKEFDESGKLVGITFFGGGNGHGAGMSQNGAKGMIDRGHTFEEVLAYFYPETDVVEMR